MKIDKLEKLMTVEDKKAVEALNFTFKFRNTLSKFRHKLNEY